MRSPWTFLFLHLRHENKVLRLNCLLNHGKSVQKVLQYIHHTKVQRITGNTGAGIRWLTLRPLCPFTCCNDVVIGRGVGLAHRTGAVARHLLREKFDSSIALFYSTVPRKTWKNAQTRQTCQQTNKTEFNSLLYGREKIWFWDFSLKQIKYFEHVWKKMFRQQIFIFLTFVNYKKFKLLKLSFFFSSRLKGR